MFLLCFAPESIKKPFDFRPMKKTVPVSLILCIGLLFFALTSFSQISIQSTKGYSVNVNIAPEAILVNGSNNKCTWGYNYNIQFSYTVTITGNNKPKKLYTLQGTIANKSDVHFFSLPKKEGSGTDKTKSNVWRSVSDCAKATVATMNLTTVNLEIEADGISYRTISYPLVIALPVKLVDFSAMASQSFVKIKWSTATETDNDYFTVERSTDENQWTAIKKVKGAGNSTSVISYEAYDDAPVNGTAYYRLKQTDIDGTISYSEIKTVTTTVSGKKPSIFPVPNTGNTINITGISDYKNYELQVINTGGHILFSSVLSKASVELPSLATGIYFVRVKNKVSGEATNLHYVKI